MNNYMLRLVLLSFMLLPLLASAPPPVYKLKGKAVRIIDGDTFDLLVGTTTHRIRLAGIDAPEKKQDFSNASKHLLGQLCNGQQLTVVVTDTDRNKRKIADIYTQQKLWINKEMIVRGMAWHFLKYSSNKELANAELLARKQKIGLWSLANPVAPWDWRKKI
ncbi:thermonuclease family protein [Lacibacter sp. H375]|uniref:thermonuclease family protein n=1 Tax=Lacibacter sp. H375 TaxID=3133424 RepID=UPI0030C199F7